MSTASVACAAAVTKFLFLNISETTRANDFTIYHNVAQDSLYISTENDVIIYFRPAANRINVLILGHVLVGIAR